jgi:hypothetical protein
MDHHATRRSPAIAQGERLAALLDRRIRRLR